VFTPTPGHACDPFGRLSPWRVHGALPIRSEPRVLSEKGGLVHPQSRTLQSSRSSATFATYGWHSAQTLVARD